MTHLRSATLAILLTCCLWPTTSRAEHFAWYGLQTVFSFEASIPVSDGIAIDTSALVFWVPRTDTRIFFAFAGPNFKLGDHAWISPKVGVVGGWTDTDMLNVAVWGGYKMPEGDFSLFLDLEWLTNGDQNDYYGYYALDHHITKWFNWGLQAEQINVGVIFGPHIHVQEGHFGFEIRYFVGLQDDINKGHALRVQTTLSF